jgi:NAD(P)-dependent dehydrogenase (short-subunit alcohol dehydrogenase family)
MDKSRMPAVIGGDPARAAGRMTGRRAIVTGAGSGIGRASARLFAAEGAAVLAVDRSRDAVEETAAAIRAAGGRAVAMAADAGSEADVQAFVARAIAEFGGLDAMYANAGISGGDVPSRRSSCGRRCCAST